MARPSISVIVPVYNGERFVGQCLQSISRQQLADIEVIIIDDGSTDGTSTICREYVGKEPRAKLIQKSNAGVSAARNSGIDVARGDYVAFVDADDWVLESGLSRLFQSALKSGADIVIGEHLVAHCDGSTVLSKIPPLVNSAEVLSAVLSGRCHGAFWNKIVRRDLFLTEKFPEDLGYLEDSVVLCRILVGSAPKVSLLHQPVYVYRQHDSSVTGSRGPKIFDMFKAQAIVAQTVRDAIRDDQLGASLCARIHHGVWFVLRTVDAAHLPEAVALAKDHLRETRPYRKAGRSDVRSVLVKSLLALPQPLATGGVRGLRWVLNALAAARGRAQPRGNFASAEAD